MFAVPVFNIHAGQCFVRPGAASQVAHFKAFAPVGTRSAEFVALLPLFRATGGLATGAELRARCERMRPDGLSDLARRIASGELISFEWNASRWLPMFQFDRQTMEMTQGSRAIVRELGDFLNGWEITKWLAAPHSALGGLMPLEALTTDLAGAIDAARLDRFIARA